MDLNSLFGAVTSAISNHSDQQNAAGSGGMDASSLINQISGLFQQHADATGQQVDTSQAVLPASQDPDGDPADQGEQGTNANILPASQDPDGDPADQR